MKTNCYIVGDNASRDVAVVDAPAHCDQIMKVIEENGYTVKYIILTHGHFDHILALNELKSATGAPILIHKDDAEFLSDENLNLCLYINRKIPPLSPDRILEDNDVIAVGNISFKVLHTPGHTAGSICLLFDNFVLSGDTLFEGTVGRIDHPTGDLAQEVSSIKKKLLPLPDCLVVYPGHGDATTIGEERKNNTYLK